MSHSWIENDHFTEVEYKWKKSDWNSFKVKAKNIDQTILQGSGEEFVTEHYWGYTKIHDSQTSEYGVEHPRWSVYKVTGYCIQVDFARLYSDAMLAEGSKNMPPATSSHLTVTSSMLCTRQRK